MRTVFGSWKYIFKNLWFVLPFSILPAIFLSLSLDYTCISEVVRGFFTGEPYFGTLRETFLHYLHAWSFIRFDSWLGAVYSLLAVVCAVVFMAAMLAFVEKHMRLGKRTLSGVGKQCVNMLLPSLLIVVLYVLLYEVWAVVLSAVLLVIGELHALAAVYVLYILCTLAFVFVLLYLSTVLYLWLPCKQMTGFRFFEALVYSYRLMSGVRWKVVLSFAVSFVAAMAVLCGCAFLPEYVFRIVGVVLFALLYLNFSIRMETVYFETDKLDREDELHRYREL